MIELLEDLGMIYPSETSKQKKRFGEYRCNCGNIFISQTRHIKSGGTMSCGCGTGTNRIIHGMSKDRLYRIWIGIKARLFNKNRLEYYNYGDRGISICNDWLTNFSFFEEWALSNGYRDDLTIDRINNDGNYEPSNCRWTTQTIQNRNTRILRKNNTSGYRGVSFSKSTNKWCAYITVSRKTKNIGYFGTKELAAIAYDNYVLSHALEHTVNFSLLGTKF